MDMKKFLASVLAAAAIAPILDSSRTDVGDHERSPEPVLVPKSRQNSSKSQSRKSQS